MQRVNYEDSGINVDTRGTATGVVTVQSTNDAPLTFSLPRGTVSSLNIYGNSLGLNPLIHTAASTIAVNQGSSTVHVILASTGAFDFTMGHGNPGQLLIVLKMNTASTLQLTYAGVGGPQINGGTSNVTGLMGSEVGILIATYHPTNGWFAMTGDNGAS
jgi:hypothetical protein